MIHATIRMRLPVRRLEEAVEILNSVAERTRFKPGCVSCRLYRDSQEKQVIMLDEVWIAQEDLDFHLRSADYRSVLLVVEMADEKPEIRFVEISHSTGLETIEKARGGGRRGENTPNEGL